MTEMTDYNTYAQFKALVSARYSCRSYSPEPLDRGMVNAVLEMAQKAPSACNRQPWRFLVVDDAASRAKICGAYSREWIQTAPAYIIACGVHSEAWHRAYDGKDHTDVDLAIAVEHICLAASSLGLGTCWVCNFDAAAITRDFNLPEGIEPIAIIPIGRPSADSHRPEKARKPLDDIVKWGSF